MFSKELEELIQLALSNGTELDDVSKTAIANRAQKEGADLAEVEVYINAQINKIKAEKQQKTKMDAAAHRKERDGNVCPHCGTEIPPLTRICPICGKAIGSNESEGDKMLNDLLDQMDTALIALKSNNIMINFDEQKAKAEALIRKARNLYSENQKVMQFAETIESEIQNVIAKKQATDAIIDEEIEELKKSRSKWVKKSLWLMPLGVGFVILLISFPAYTAKINAKLAMKNASKLASNAASATAYAAKGTVNFVNDIRKDKK